MEIRIEGMDELEKQLKELEKSLNPDKIEPILLEAAYDLAEAMRAKAPQGPTGNLKKSIRARLLKQYAGHPAAGAGVDRKKASHAHLVEFGTVQRHQKSGKSTGTMPAKPFLRPAWDSNKERITRKVIENIKGLIDKCL
jgi:HK97 gp10 family phage protein